MKVGRTAVVSLRLTVYTFTTEFNRIETVTVDASGANPVLTTYRYDTNGNLTEIEDAENGAAAKRLFTYNGNGQVLTATDNNGNVTTYAYDADGNLDTVTDALTNVTKYTRDTIGRATQITEGFGAPEARTTQYVFDALNRVTSMTRGFGTAEAATTSYTFDNRGNIETVTNPTGEVTTYTYDNLNRILTTNHPARGTTTNAYDSAGNLQTVTDQLGNVTTYIYDVANRRIQSSDAKLQDRFFSYDDNGNQLTVTDARGKITTFTYDPLNRNKSRANHAGETHSFTFDARNNLFTSLDPKGQELARIYDKLDRLTSVELRPSAGAPANDTLVFTYDPNGNLIGADDNDSELSFTPDALDRLASAATGAGGIQPVVTLSHGYNAVHDRIQTIDTAGAGGTTGYLHDPLARLVQVTTPGAQVVTIDHDTAGRIVSVTNPNGINAAMAYDPAGRLASLSHGPGGSEIIAKTYGYDAVANINNITGQSRTRSFVYDELYRLTDATDTAGNETYSLDPEGNRISSHISAAHITDDVNRLTEDDQFTYVYDLNGNLQSKTSKATSDVTSYSYDELNRLTSITHPDTTATTYAYDAFGRRIEKNVNGAITHYIYDGNDIFLEYDGTSALLARYSHGDRTDEPLVQERGGQSYFYHADHQGSVLKITDSAGATVNDYEYDSYGRVVAEVEALVNPYRYTGREWDGESGLYFYRARTFDPATGRFLQEDPIHFGGGDLNLYRYVGGNPLNRTDPNGQTALPLPPPAIPIIIGIGVGVCIATECWKSLNNLICMMASSNDRSGRDILRDLGVSVGKDGDDDKSDCEELYRIDTDTCNAISRKRGPGRGAACHASAAERYSACLAGKPLPPLNTWNN